MFTILILASQSMTEMSLKETQGSKKEGIPFSYKLYQCGNKLNVSKHGHSVQSLLALVHYSH